MNQRPAVRPLRRLAPILIGLGAAYVLQHFFGTHPVELLVTIPAAQDDGAGLDVRITREHDAKLVLEVNEAVRASKGHTVVIPTRLAFGRYEARAWLDDSTHKAFIAVFAFDSGDAAEVNLVAR